MSEHPNAVMAQRTFAAWNAGHLDVIRDVFSDDIILHFAGNNALSGAYRGHDAVMGALGRAFQVGGPRVEMESLLASDAHVMAFFHAMGERDSTTLDVVLAMAIKVNAAGKMKEIWFLANDQPGYDRFWS
jgi:ketosteroid isomerase-like protein